MCCLYALIINEIFRLSMRLAKFFDFFGGLLMYERIKALAASKGLTIQALEVISNIKRGTIGKWKTSVPNAEALYRVANALGTTVDYLLTGEYRFPAEPEADVASLLQQMKDDPSTRMMFDLAKGATIDEIKATVAFLKALRETRDK